MVACAGIFPFTAIPPQHGGRFFFFFNAALLMVVCRWFIMNQASVYIRYLQKLIQELCGVTGMTLESWPPPRFKIVHLIFMHLQYVSVVALRAGPNMARLHYWDQFNMHIAVLNVDFIGSTCTQFLTATHVINIVCRNIFNCKYTAISTLHLLYVNVKVALLSQGCKSRSTIKEKTSTIILQNKTFII